MVIGISMILGAPESMTNMLQIIAAWSSTFAFVFLFKKIYPGVRLRDFVKDQFAERISFSVLGTAVIIQIIIITVIIFLLSIDTQNLGLSFTSVGILIFAFLDNLVRGPLGEELGWRGYALNELQKKYSPLKSALIVGVL